MLVIIWSFGLFPNPGDIVQNIAKITTTNHNSNITMKWFKEHRIVTRDGVHKILLCLKILVSIETLSFLEQLL